jgi:hypothetical protein
VALCALVFFFALRAKTAVYNGGAPAKVTPSTASKLWLSSQKMEVQPVDTNAAILFWMTILSFFALFLHREPRIQRIGITPLPRNISLLYLHHFLRPPPLKA